MYIYIYVYVYGICITESFWCNLKLTQHCKSTILQYNFFFKNKKTVGSSNLKFVKTDYPTSLGARACMFWSESQTCVDLAE